MNITIWYENETFAICSCSQFLLATFLIGWLRVKDIFNSICFRDMEISFAWHTFHISHTLVIGNRPFFCATYIFCATTIIIRPQYLLIHLTQIMLKKCAPIRWKTENSLNRLWEWTRVNFNMPWKTPKNVQYSTCFNQTSKTTSIRHTTIDGDVDPKLWHFCWIFIFLLDWELDSAIFIQKIPKIHYFHRIASDQM